MSRDPTITALLWTHLCRGRYFLILFLWHFPVCLTYLMKEQRTIPVERCLTGRVDDMDVSDKVTSSNNWLSYLGDGGSYLLHLPGSPDSLTSAVLIEQVRISSRFVTRHPQWWSKLEYQLLGSWFINLYYSTSLAITAYKCWHYPIECRRSTADALIGYQT